MKELVVAFIIGIVVGYFWRDNEIAVEQYRKFRD